MAGRGWVVPRPAADFSIPNRNMENMLKEIFNLRRSLISKLILVAGAGLLLGISILSINNIRYQKNMVMSNLCFEADRFTTTIKLGAHYAMMLNSRDDIAQIIKNISKQPEIENIRIYNKDGQIKYSNHDEEVDMQTNIKAEACYVCHRTEPPLVQLDLKERTRIFEPKDGHRFFRHPESHL